MEKLYAGIRKGAAEFGVGIVGGETSRAPLLAIIVSLTGRVRRNRCALRRGARAGDLIYVTGRLGGSLAKHHLDFTPRVREGQWLGTRKEVHAMMDLSDGLAKDLPRMAAASGVEFVIEERSLPCNKGCDPEQAWGDGEDYELLLAVEPRHAAVLEKQWAGQFPKLKLTKIGSFVPKGRGRVASFFSKGWEHFR
jgi:thiamine-monophosphate kinase